MQKKIYKNSIISLILAIIPIIIYLSVINISIRGDKNIFCVLFLYVAIICLPLSVLSIIFGSISLSKSKSIVEINDTVQENKKKKLTKIGLIIGIIDVSILIVMFIFWIIIMLNGLDSFFTNLRNSYFY